MWVSKFISKNTLKCVGVYTNASPPLETPIVFVSAANGGVLFEINSCDFYFKLLFLVALFLKAFNKFVFTGSRRET
jgi:hypothetical protein